MSSSRRDLLRAALGAVAALPLYGPAAALACVRRPERPDHVHAIESGWVELAQFRAFGKSLTVMDLMRQRLGVVEINRPDGSYLHYSTTPRGAYVAMGTPETSESVWSLDPHTRHR